MREGYEAFSRGDASVAQEFSTADVEWGTTGSFPGIEGVYSGPATIRVWVETVRSAWEEFEASLQEVIHDEDGMTVVAEHLRGRGAGSGVEVQMTVYSVYRWKGNLIRSRRAFTDRAAALAEAGLRD